MCIMVFLLLFGCNKKKTEEMAITVYQTSAAGDNLKQITTSASNEAWAEEIVVNTGETFQTITGFGGAFTESSATLLNQLSAEKRNQIMEAYFSSEGAQYSLTRTHMNSCDFSIDHYSYAPIAGDTALESFSIAEDTADLIHD